MHEIGHLDIKLDPRGVARVNATGQKHLQRSGRLVK
jgi:hypothetical protein